MTTRINAAYGAIMALLGVSVFALPGMGVLSWALIGMVSAGAVLLGVHRYRATPPLAWWLLAGAVVAMAAGDALYATAAHQGPDAAPAIADVCYLAMFPLIMAGLIAMVRTGAGLRDWSRWLDVLTFLCAAALLGWVVLTAPALAADRLSNAEKSSLAAYNLGDLLVLVTTVRLVLAARRSASVLLLAAGSVALLVGDVSYTLDQLGSGWHPGGAADLAYLLFYLLWGAAALQPSMVRVITPVPTRGSFLQARWAVLLGVSLTIPPAIMVIEATTGPARDELVIGVVSALMSALVITRLVGALTQQRQALARERALRQASGTLLSVLTGPGVEAALHEAVGAVIPANEPHEIIVALDHDGPELRGRLAHHPSVLSCPLDTDPAVDRRPVGVLLVAADPRVLASTEDSIRVLAAQATLALQRIALTEELHRRDSDQYLQTITRNSADLVLIVDDDLGIRYASTSVAATFGLDQPVLLTLHDLEQVDDHGQIARTLASARCSSQPDGSRDWWNLRRSDGRALTLEVNCRDLRQDRTVRGYVIVMRDVTQDEGQRRELLRQALDASAAGQNRRRSHLRFH